MRFPARILAGLTAAVAALAIAAPAAPANVVSRPTTTWIHDAQWLVAPSLANVSNVLDDDVLQPQTPNVTDFLYGSGKGTFYTAVGMAPPALAQGESITGATAWVYASTGADQWLTASLWTGSTLLGWRSFAPAQGAAWRSVPVTQALTSDQASHLSLLLRSDNAKNSSWGNVSAAYVDVATTGGPTPAPPDGTDAPPASGPPPAAPPTVSITDRVVKVKIERGHTVAPLTLGCPATAVQRCRGTLTIRLITATPRSRLAVMARCGRGCRPIGKGPFEVASGRRRKVKVRMSLRTGQVFGHRRRVRAKITADTRDAGGTRSVSSTIVTLTR